MRALLSCALGASFLASTAGAQSFNVDVGSVAFGFGTPAATYGAAANSAGPWNAIDADQLGTGVYTSAPLTTTTGAASPVVLEFDPLGLSFFPLEFDEPNTLGDDESLMDDAYYASGSHQLTVRNLAAGSYVVYSYAMAPDSNAYQTGVEVVGSTDPLQAVGGDFSAGFQLGVTHARHAVTVAAGGTIVINFSVANQFDTINGLQIVAGSGGGLGLNYCAANVNSTGVFGAISASGSALVASNNVTLRSASLPLNSFGFFLTSLTQGNIANPGGSQGVLCLAGSIGRYVGAGQIKNSGATGQFTLALNLTQHPTPGGLVAVTPGQTWNFTCWYRDVVGGTATSNFTNGLSVTFQ